LCHKLPIMTRTCGLCQTLAFIEDKKSKNDPRGSAYKQLHDDIKKLLGVTGGLLETVRDAPLHDYIRYTRRLLGGWVFFKRFAVSILKVETPANDGEKP
jgi:CRISPR-associated protein Cmr5